MGRCNLDNDLREGEGYGNDTYVAWILHHLPVC